MHCERRLLTTLIARDVTDPGPVPIRVLDSGLLMGVLDSGLLMGGTFPGSSAKCGH